MRKDCTEAVPYRIHTVLTDNGIQFTFPPRYADGPTACYITHMFDPRCRENGIEHRRTCFSAYRASRTRGGQCDTWWSLIAEQTGRHCLIPSVGLTRRQVHQASPQRLTKSPALVGGGGDMDTWHRPFAAKRFPTLLKRTCPLSWASARPTAESQGSRPTPINAPHQALPICNSFPKTPPIRIYRGVF